MTYSHRALLCLIAAAAGAVSCGKRQPEVRERTFVAVEPPVKMNDFTCPALARTSKGVLVITAFPQPTAATATEPYDAIAVHGRSVSIAWLDGRPVDGTPPRSRRATAQDVYFASSADRGGTWSATGAFGRGCAAHTGRATPQSRGLSGRSRLCLYLVKGKISSGA
jgi:hypothetical protein